MSVMWPPENRKACCAPEAVSAQPTICPEPLSALAKLSALPRVDQPREKGQCHRTKAEQPRIARVLAGGLGVAGGAAASTQLPVTVRKAVLAPEQREGDVLR
jgi:hypothetical protein